jgi:putative flippase GtrA
MSPDRHHAGGPTHDVRSWTHWAGFIGTGFVAYTIDTVMTKLLISFAAWSPYLARLVGIAVAMVAAWRLHRRFTFRMTTPPSLAEFGNFATVAWLASALNYAVFSLLMLMRPETEPALAIALAAGVAMVFSYIGYARATFRAPS